MLTCTAGVLTRSVEHIERVLHTATPTGESIGLTTVSAVRCLNVYLERLDTLNARAVQAERSGLQSAIIKAFESPVFVSVQPSLLAAVAYHTYKESRGTLPAWPSALADLTGWTGGSPDDLEFHRVLVAMRAFVTDA